MDNEGQLQLFHGEAKTLRDASKRISAFSVLEEVFGEILPYLGKDLEELYQLVEEVFLFPIGLSLKFSTFCKYLQILKRKASKKDSPSQTHKTRRRELSQKTVSKDEFSIHFRNNDEPPEE